MFLLVLQKLVLRIIHSYWGVGWPDMDFQSDWSIMAKGIEAANISRCYCCNWYQAEWKKCLKRAQQSERSINNSSQCLPGWRRKKNNCRIIITRCCCWNNVMNSVNQTRHFLSKKNTSMESTLKEWYRRGRCNFLNLSKTCFFPHSDTNIHWWWIE